MKNSWRCVLVGSESLLVQCAQTLVNAGHHIAAIVSAARPIRQWALQTKTTVLLDTQELLLRQDLGPFDYLFSITHLSVLSPEVIALPLQRAINFHDGPLPAYGGLNTPVWALLNGEKEHGITWHLMTGKVDQGAILARRSVSIAPDETALSINTKCFEAGVESFESLIQDLMQGDLQPQTQASPIGRFYKRKDRPAAACTVDWTQSALEIATLVRALDFGNYANPVGCPKTFWLGQPLLLGDVKVGESRSGAPPGTIIGLSAQSMSVATGSTDLSVQRFATLNGKEISTQGTESFCRWSVGARFDTVSPGLAERLSLLDARVAASEDFWRQRLASLVPVQLPTIDRSATPQAPRYSQCVVHPPGLGDSDGSPADRVLSLTLAYLARVTDQEMLSVGYSDAALGLATQDVQGWFAQCVPLQVKVDFLQGAHACMAATQEELSVIRKRLTFALDLVARSPELRTLSAQGGTEVLHLLPVAVVMVDTLQAAAPVPGSELTIVIESQHGNTVWFFDVTKLSADAIAHLQSQWSTLIGTAVCEPHRPLFELPLLDLHAQTKILVDWNATQGSWRSEACVHHLIEEQAQRTPEKNALICQDQTLSFSVLDLRANQLSRRLAAMGVGPDVLVGVCTERCIEMMVGLLAIHKAGGAYVPLDPTYPPDRIAYMVEDSKVRVLLTQKHLLEDLPPHQAQVVCLDADWPSIEKESTEPLVGKATPESLAYVIYTSGSTGKPKGVMVEHRNVLNFFAGMDKFLGADAAGVWLAVTSLSFDISVLELFWTLTRGYTVVIATHEERAAQVTTGAASTRPIDFSLFYFSSDESENNDHKYRLLLEGAKYGDEHGFAGVWTPERHFHAFGGLYPNPAITSAAIAAVTQRIQIRAGSVVLPLHHPIRVAEDWSVVDNISRGRVGVSFASGWQPNDFVLRPENFANNKQVLLRDIDVVRKLWRGEKVGFPGATGEVVEISILPRPVQKELPIWVTSAGNPDTFIAAGKLGAYVLTHLLGQTVQELASKLEAYRAAWRDAGHPGVGYVSLMLHTLVGPDEEDIRRKVRQPLIDYLRSSVNLIKQYAWSFPAFKKREGMDTSGAGVDLQSLSPGEMTELLEHSFHRYYESSGLFGTPAACMVMVEKLKAIGVDDIACLIDFGIDSATVMAHLSYLNQLRKMAVPRRASPTHSEHALPVLLERHGVTHLQCTPSMARMLLLDEKAKQGLAGLKRLMIGGEAFASHLAHELRSLLSRGEVMNMYGPTETTIWSAVHRIKPECSKIPLGKPLLNQQIYILDSRMQPVPVGVPGELVIGGAGVVRGYLHRPELTADRFVAHPIQGAAAGRVYRTGDLAQFLPDGSVEFLGRLDHQVKVRGYRIELGEIEAALLHHSGVQEAVVLAREDTPGDVRLVAYLVLSGTQTPADSELRDHLRIRLPDYMVPAHFVSLSALPQTPNGKLDRKALRAPETSRVSVPATFIAPHSDVEQQIAAIWKEVLNLPQVGTRDNFFDLGGHSLLAVQVHRKLRDALQRELSITEIFRFPTIASLSAHLTQEGGDSEAAQQGIDRAQGRRAALQRRQTRPTAGHRG